MKAYDNVFHVYDTLFNEEDKKSLVEIVEALYRNNYNVVYSAKDLFIHRNTLIFRLNKLKEILNIDPIANAADREFLNELAYYFGKK
jgi:carbohydrate diacid regulator